MKKILKLLSILVVMFLVFSNVGPTFAQAIENKESNLFSEEIISVTDLDSEYVDVFVKLKMSHQRN